MAQVENKGAETKNIYVPGPDDDSSVSSFEEDPKRQASSDEDDNQEEVEKTSEEEEEESKSVTTTEILENDPLYFVLAQLFISSTSRKNVADLLEELVEILKTKGTGNA